MAQALIVVNGVVGSNDDLPIDTVVNLSNQNNGGETQFLWEILDQPPGPLDTLASTNTVSTSFRPKKEGSYLIQLTVNANPDLVDRAVAAVRFLKTRERAPAAQEQNEVNTTRGWAGATNSWFASLNNSVADPGIVIGKAEVAMNSGDVLRVSPFDGYSVLKLGLPGQEDIVQFTKADGNAFNNVPLFLCLGSNTGTSFVGAGQLVKARLFGLSIVSLPSANIGDPVYFDLDGDLTIDPTSMQSPRSVGNIVGEIGSPVFALYFNGLSQSSAAVELQMTGVGDISVAPANTARIINEDNTLKASVNGGAYVDIGGSGSVYTAGLGLSLVGNEFSVATGGIVETMIDFAAVTQAKLSLVDPVSSLEAATKQYVDGLAEPFDVGFYFSGQPDVDEVVLRYTFSRSVEFPAGLTGSSGSVEVPAASVDCEFSLFKVSSGVSTLIGSFLFGPADTQPSFSLGSAVTFDAGDTLRVVGPLGSADGSFSGFSVTFKGVKA